MSIILALRPNNRGLGYVCIERPGKLIEHGVMSLKEITDGRVLERVQKFMDFYRPKIIVLRDGSSTTYKGKRFQRLAEGIAKLALARQLPVYQYSRQQIKDVFEVLGASNKHDITRNIIGSFPELGCLAPRIRKPWMDEDYSMGVFDALALVITHLYLTD